MDTLPTGAPAPALDTSAIPAAPAATTVVVPEPGAAPAAPDAAAAPAAPVQEAEPLSAENMVPQSRFNRVTAQKYAAITRAEAAEKRLAEVTQRLAAGAPNPAAYQDPSKLMVDTMRHVSAETQAEQLKIDAQAARAEAATISQDEFSQRIDAKRTAIPDIDIIMRDPSQGGPEISPTMAELIQHTDNGLDVAYYLAKNPAVSKQIAALPPMQQIFETGRIAQRLVAAPPKTSSAPPPVPTVGGRPTAAGVSLADMPMADYIRMRNEEERKSGW